MSVLSIVAVGRLAERRVRQAGTPLPVEDVVSWLVGAVGVQDDRARAGVRLAVTVCRLEITTAADGRPCLQLPDSSGDGPVSLVSEAAATPATSRREDFSKTPPGGSVMPDTPDLAGLSDTQLEQMLIGATAPDVPGRRALATVTAVRTLLRQRRDRRRAVEHEEDAHRHARALEMANAVRGPKAQLTALHPVDVASVLADPEWAGLVCSDDELRAMADAHTAAVRARSLTNQMNKEK